MTRHATKVLHLEIAIATGAVAQTLQLVVAWRPSSDERLMEMRVARLKRFASAAWSCAEALNVVGDRPLSGDLEHEWPTRDVLRRLAAFARDRLTIGDFDGHAHETLRLCVDRADEILQTNGPTAS